MDWLRSVRATSWKSKFHAFPFFASHTLHCNAEILFHFHLTSLWKNFIEIFTLEKKLACEQALQGALATGRQKEGELATHLWNLNICIKIVNAKCWLVKMTLVMTSLPLAHVLKFLVKFVLVSAQLMGSHSGIGGGIQIPDTSHSFKLSFLFPPCCQRAPESLLAG